MRYILSILISVFSLSAPDIEAVEHLTTDAHPLAQAPSVEVHIPDSYLDNDDVRYPVIYVLDGRANAHLISSMLRRMHVSDGAFEHIVVGLESARRLDDFAPTENRDPRGPVGAGGGGDRFLDFIQHTLMPKVNKRYRTSGHNAFAGHSVGGLLVLHSFQSRPDLFQAHLAFSPAVWWGERTTLKATERYVKSDKPIQNFLYMNIGNEGGEMRAVYDAFAYTLSRHRTLDLDLHLDTFKYEGHDFTLVAGLYNALKGLHQYQQQSQRLALLKEQ